MLCLMSPASSAKSRPEDYPTPHRLAPFAPWKLVANVLRQKVSCASRQNLGVFPISSARLCRDCGAHLTRSAGFALGGCEGGLTRPAADSLGLRKSGNN